MSYPDSSSHNRTGSVLPQAGSRVIFIFCSRKRLGHPVSISTFLALTKITLYLPLLLRTFLTVTPVPLILKRPCQAVDDELKQLTKDIGNQPRQEDETGPCFESRDPEDLFFFWKPGRGPQTLFRFKSFVAPRDLFLKRLLR